MSDTTKSYKFEGFSSPNTTPVPDVLFDELLLQLDNAELRVLLYIIRRTYGFKKSSDDISTGQMVDGITRKDGTVLDRGTGLARTSVKRAIRGLLEKNIIIRKHNQAADGGNEPNTYGLRYETPKQDETPQNEAKTPRSNGGPTPLVSPADPPSGRQRTPQQTVEQQTDSSNIRTAAPGKMIDDVTSQQPPALAAAGVDASQLGITVKRGGAPKPVAELLNRYRQHTPASSEEADERAAITATIKTLAPELGDKAPVRSSVTRAYHLYQRSRLPLSTFVAELYGVRSDVKDIATRRKIKNKMSYFFGLLEDRLGLSPVKPEEASTPAIKGASTGAST